MASPVMRSARQSLETVFTVDDHPGMFWLDHPRNSILVDPYNTELEDHVLDQSKNEHVVDGPPALFVRLMRFFNDPAVRHAQDVRTLTLPQFTRADLSQVLGSSGGIPVVVSPPSQNVAL